MPPAPKSVSAAASAAAHPQAAEPTTLDIAHPKVDLPIAVALQKMAAETGTSPLQVMRDYASLAFGPGRVSFRDYTNLRLFDEARYAGTDKRTVVGARRARDIAVTVNYRQDWYGILDNKITANAYLSAFGLPTIPTAALFAEKLGNAAPKLLRSTEDLGTFLRCDDVYPLFGKPVEGVQSLGSAGLVRYDRTDDRIERSDGETIAADAFIKDVVTHYADGYLFQPLTQPHPDVAALCGPRLSTCRMITLYTEDGPQLHRAVWKIPAEGNAADNYWRAGNILARIDLASGRVEGAMTGAGLSLRDITHHPDTGAQLIGAQVPNWEVMKATSVEGARVMRHVPMIGWDIAPAANGSLIVEMNEVPDVFLNQLADARGFLQPEFVAFMAFQKRNAAAAVRVFRAELAKL